MDDILLGYAGLYDFLFMLGTVGQYTATQRQLVTRYVNRQWSLNIPE